MRKSPVTQRQTASVVSRAAHARGIPLLPIAIVAVLVLLGWSIYPVARMHYKEQRDLAKLQHQLADIRARNERLKHEVDALKTPQGVEEAARQLGLARQGEQVWVPIPEGTKPGSLTPAPNIRTADVTPDVWTRLLDTVFGVGP